jgi:hypothetical protein
MRRLAVVLLAALGVAFGATPAHAETEYYVNPSTVNGIKPEDCEYPTCGTAGKPWKDVEYADLHVPAGKERVYIKLVDPIKVEGTHKTEEEEQQKREAETWDEQKVKLSRSGTEAAPFSFIRDPVAPTVQEALRIPTVKSIELTANWIDLQSVSVKGTGTCLVLAPTYEHDVASDVFNQTKVECSGQPIQDYEGIPFVNEGVTAYPETWENFSGINPPTEWRHFGSSESDFSKPIPVACDKKPGEQTGCLKAAESTQMVEWTKAHSRATGANFPKVLSRFSTTKHEGQSPLAYASSTDPLYELVWKETPSCGSGYKTRGERDWSGKKIRVPGATESGSASDKGLTVVLPPKEVTKGERYAEAPGEAIDFWQAELQSTEKKLDFCTAGRSNLATGSLVAPKDAEGHVEATTAAGFNKQAGIVRGPELKYGTINHALVTYLESCKKAGSEGPLAPAVDEDCNLTEPAYAPREGQRFFLRYTEKEIEERSAKTTAERYTNPEKVSTAYQKECEGEASKCQWKPWKVAMVTALARYGVYVRDSGNKGFSIQYESENSVFPFGAPDPFITIGNEQNMAPAPKTGEERKEMQLNLNETESGIEWSRMEACSKWNCE